MFILPGVLGTFLRGPDCVYLCAGCRDLAGLADDVLSADFLV